jgi:uncharacterized membrane protein
MDLTLLLALSLHTLAFVIAWGYYGILGRILIPALRRSLDPATEAVTLAAIERRALPLVIVSTAMFVVTGSYLLVVDSSYAGLGNVFANTWTVLMLAKHLVVIGLVGLGATVDLQIRRAADAPDSGMREAALGRVRLAAEAATVLGALIVLLTVAAQQSA